MWSTAETVEFPQTCRKSGLLHLESAIRQTLELNALNDVVSHLCSQHRIGTPLIKGINTGFRLKILDYGERSGICLKEHRIRNIFFCVLARRVEGPRLGYYSGAFFRGGGYKTDYSQV